MPFSGLLYAARELEEAQYLVDRTIGRLLAHDAENPGREMFRTFEAVVENDFNLKSASEKLYLHYNTLKYRYAQICDILQLDLSTFHNRAKVYVALLLYRLSN